MEYKDFEYWGDAVKYSEESGFMILARVNGQCRKVFPNGETLPLTGEED